MPCALCAVAAWVRIVSAAPAIRQIVPVDNFEVFHRLLGTLALGAIALGAVLWAATMVPACLGGTRMPWQHPPTQHLSVSRRSKRA